MKGSYLPGSDTNPTFDDYAEAITSALINFKFEPDKLPLLILETGRALIDDAGYLLGTVIANKRHLPEDELPLSMLESIFCLLLFGMIIKLHLHRNFSHYAEETTIVRPSCV